MCFYTTVKGISNKKPYSLLTGGYIKTVIKNVLNLDDYSKVKWYAVIFSGPAQLSPQGSVGVSEAGLYGSK